MKKNVLLVAALLSLWPALGSATPVTPSEKQTRPAQLVLLHAAIPAWVLGKARPDATVVVSGGVVRCVGACVVPSTATKVDVHGAMVVPGFFEPAAHIGQLEVSLEPTSHDGKIMGLDNAAHVHAVDGLHLNSRVLKAALRGGVTGTMSAPMGPALIVGQSVAFRTAGTVADKLPAVVAPTVAVHVQLGNGPKRHRGRAAVGARSGQIAVLRALLTEAKARSGKGGGARPWTLGSRSTLAGVKALIPVVQGRQQLAVHAHRAGDILAALRVAASFKLKMVLIGGAEAHVVARQLAAAKVAVILSPVIARDTSFDTARARPDAALILHRAGVRLALSTGRTHNARNLRWHAGMAVSKGLPKDVALQAISVTALRIFGLESAWGGLRVGGVANLVVIDGDPLGFSGRIRHVLVGDRLLSHPQQR